MQNGKGLTSRELDYFLSARAKYHRLLRRCMTKLSPLKRVVCAVETIETINRTVLWRSFEYLFLCLSIPRLLFLKRLTNMSIGVYQLKIFMILQYIGYECKLYKKTITVRGPSLLMIKGIFANRNNAEILIQYFTRFHIISAAADEQLNVASLRRALMEYSHNVDFDGSLNYYTLCIFLLFSSLPDR